MLRENNGKVIEFIGLPGSGKTTTTHELLNILSEQNVSFFTRNDMANLSIRNNRTIYFLILLFSTFLNYKLVFYISVYIWNSKLFTKEDFNRFKNIYVRYYLISQLKKKAIKENVQFIILEEGVIHLLWCLLLDSKGTSKETLVNVLKQLNINNHLFVYLNLTNEIAAERVKKRVNINNSRFDKLEFKELITIYEKNEYYYEYMIKFFKKEEI